MEAEDWLDCCARKTTKSLFEDMRQLHRVESEMIAPILAHLSELDKREAVLAEAFPSLFSYCVSELGYSEAEAFLRIRAARAARRFPRILGMLARREIHVSAIGKLAPHLTSENYRSLLDRASRRTIEEIQTMVAELAPEPEKRPVIRTLSVGMSLLPEDPAKGDLFAGPAGSGDPLESPPTEAATPAIVLPIRHDEPSPVLIAEPVPAVESRVLFNFVGRESLRRKLKRAAEILRHKYPRGEPDLLFEQALDDLLDRRDPGRRIARKLNRGSIRRRPEVLD
ncbi:MAG: hypothetical protein HYZ75_14335 [Elusimicrobia bacterium]|nr:hypothetical protein [Elusimicrobiota bacterium]